MEGAIEQINADNEQFYANLEERKAKIEANLKGRKVFPIVLIDMSNTANRVVGFALKPDIHTQMKLIDMGQDFRNGVSLEACSKALESLIIKTETDERILDTENYPEYWKGACLTLGQFHTVAISEFKKK